MDVFLNPDKPEDAVVNEVSMSSGYRYAWHWPMIAEAWANGHRDMRSRLSLHTPSSQKIDHGKCFYARFFSRCNHRVLSERLWHTCGCAPKTLDRPAEASHGHDPKTPRRHAEANHGRERSQP